MQLRKILFTWCARYAEPAFTADLSSAVTSDLQQSRAHRNLERDTIRRL
jgi:hypothetical protein